jgi:hypothetical protein
MRFFVFSIWVLSYGLPILPAGILFTSKFPFTDLPDEAIVLTILPVSLYIVLHSIQNRQRFNFITANLFISFPATIALILISFQHDLIQYAYKFTLLSCVLVLVIWWKYPVRQHRIF